MTSGRARWSISAQSRLSSEELTARCGSTYPPLRIVSPNHTTIHAAIALRPLTAKAPSSTIARRWTTRPRVLLDRELRIVRTNRSLCRSFGVPQGSLIGTRLDDWINVDPGVLACLSRKIDNGPAPWHVILRLRLSGSRVLAASQILRPLRSHRGGYLLISLAGVQLA